MIAFDIDDFIRRNTERLFSSKYTVDDGKVEFYPGLIPPTTVLSGVDYINDLIDIQDA